MADSPRDTEQFHPLGDPGKPAAFARGDDARALAPERERHGFLSAEPEPVLLRQTGQTTSPGVGTPPRFVRDDLVLRKGEYTLMAGHFTPHESMVDDLLAVRAALIAAGIDFLLVRGDNDRPVIAVDRRQRKKLSRALAEAFHEEPFYSTTLDRPGEPSVLLADGALSPARKAAVFRLYRPRVEPIGRLRYGPETAFQLELWRFGDDEIVAPRENALMRARMPRHEAVEDTVELYGRRWRTLEHMFAELASDVSFDIDMVFSWVDGSDAAFQKARAARMAGYVIGDGDDSDARFR